MKRSLITTVVLLAGLTLLSSCAQKKEAAATTYSKDAPATGSTTGPQDKAHE